MSSWIGDWERALMPMVNGRKAKERTQCKLGRHTILEGVEAVWLKSPMGLSCFPCAEKVDPEAVALERARLAAPAPKKAVPAPRQPSRRRGELVHGTASGYTNHKCRCVPCRAANSRRSAEYRERRRQREGSLT